MSIDRDSLCTFSREQQFHVDPERTAEAIKRIRANSADKKLKKLEDKMRLVQAQMSGVKLSSRVHIDDLLPSSKTLARWQSESTPPRPQSACLILALKELSEIDISIDGICGTTFTNFGRRTSISILSSGPLNVSTPKNVRLFELHSLDFRSFSFREEVNNPNERIPSKVKIAFDELMIHLNLVDSQIDRGGALLNRFVSKGDEIGSSKLRITFSGFPESSWIVDVSDDSNTINGYLHLPEEKLCRIEGELTAECSLRILCRPENLVVEPDASQMADGQNDKQKYFRKKLAANLIRDDIFKYPGYYLLKEEPILGGEDAH